MIDSTLNGLFEGLCDSINSQYGTDETGFAAYQDNPVGFGEEILKEAYTEDVKLLMESVRDNPVTVAVSANATGKTHGAARVAIWFYKSFKDSQVYTAAAPPESNLKRLLWGEISGIAESHPDLFTDDTITTLNIKQSAKVFLTGVTIPLSGTEAQREAKFSGKHSPNLLFLLDEGDAIPESVYSGIESCMSGGHARLLVMFNPRSEQGSVYRMIRDKRANVVHLSAFSHPNVMTGQDQIPGAVTRDTTVRRVNEWCRPLSLGESKDAECFELPDFLEGATARSLSGTEYPPLKPGYYKIMESAFSYMVLGKYPAQGSTKLISKGWLEAARSRWDLYVAENGEVPPMYTQATMGLDIAEYGSDANCACFRYGGYVECPTTWSGIDVVSSADKAAELYRSKNVSRCSVDATGVGAGAAPQMQRNGCSANPVKVASSPTETSEMGSFGILRDQLWWACREWLRTDVGAMLPPDELFLEELMTPTYEIKNGKIRVMDKKTMRELLKRSPDRADALCLTFAPGGFFSACNLE